MKRFSISLREFISWYANREVGEVDSSLLEDIGWDYFDIPIDAVVTVFNDSLGKVLNFSQSYNEHGFITFSFNINGYSFEVDSTRSFIL